MLRKRLIITINVRALLPESDVTARVGKSERSRLARTRRPLDTRMTEHESGKRSVSALGCVLSWICSQRYQMLSRQDVYQNELQKESSPKEITCCFAYEGQREVIARRHTGAARVELL